MSTDERNKGDRALRWLLGLAAATIVIGGLHAAAGLVTRVLIIAFVAILLSAAVGLVAKYLGQAGGYAPYIVEKHHIHKLDAPSGTAKSLAAVVKENMGVNPDIAAVRVGELAGIHTVGFEGAADRITLTHEAFSRKGFAEGAVLAATMTEGLSGVHEFKELFFKESTK